MSFKDSAEELSDNQEADLGELEEILKHATKKKPPTKRERRIFESATSILKNTCGVISTTYYSKVQINAAELLVDDYCLTYVEDLFQNVDYIDPDGYVKLVPDEMDLMFCGRLAKYNMTWNEYLQSIIIPDIWINRLSANGIQYLSTMNAYRHILNAPSHQSSNNVQTVDHHYNTSETQLASNENDIFLNDESLNLNQDIEQTDFGNIYTSTPKRISNYENNSTQDHIKATDTSNLISNNTTSIVTNNIDNTKPHIDWNKLPENVVGLSNLDVASCYINAVIQCLASTPPLVDWMINHKHHLTTCQLSNQEKFCSICQLANIIQTISSFSKQNTINQDAVVVASNECIRSNLKKISPLFMMEEQEDAALFITSLIDHCAGCFFLHTSMLSTMQSTATIIDQIFRITLLNTIECPSCFNISTKEEFVYTLSVEINNMNYLCDALAHFVKREILTVDEKYRCLNCSTLVQASKRFTIHNLPPVLIISLKRSTGFGTSTKKHAQKVNYDDLLNIYPYVTEKLLDSDKENQKNIDSNDYVYQLYAIINHISNNNANGHYHAYIRTSKDKWFLVNDSHYQQVSSEEVFDNKDASVFFYGKASHGLINMNLNSIFSRKTLQCSSIDNHVVITRTISNPSISTNVSPTNAYSITSADKQVLINKCQLNTNSTSKTIDTNIDEQLNIVTDIEVPDEFTESSITIGSKSSKEMSKTPTSNINRVVTKRLMDDSILCSTPTPASSKRARISFTNISDSVNSQKDISRVVASVAAGVPLGESFKCRLREHHKFNLTSTKLIKMLNCREKVLKKKHDDRMKQLGLLPESSISSLQEKRSNNKSKSISINKSNYICSTNKKKRNKPSIRIVDIEYFYILWSHLKKYNPYCALCVCTRYFGRDVSKPTSLLLKCVLQCSGRYCEFKCKVIVRNNGECYIIASNTEVNHYIYDRISRPVRGEQRIEIKEKFKAGGSVFRVHAQYNAKRTTFEKEAFNYDATGISKKIFKKIKAEVVAHSLLAPDVTSGILNLHDQLVDDINSDGVLPGALQMVQSRPFCTIVFTEASIRLYDTIVTHKDSVLSWDATGGIVKNFGSKQILYYELTISHPNIVNEDGLIPLTFMLSECQSLFTITQWLLAFKDNHRKIFPHKKDALPRPAIILSDRAQVFLQSSLRVFNDENYQQFLSRAYRIVTQKALPNDFLKTNIHACLAHFMLDMRKLVNKHLPAEIREFGMWSIALLVNSSTYDEIKQTWRLICQVFLNNTTNSNLYFKKYYTILLSRISNITIDPNVSKAISKSNDVVLNTNDPFDFDDEVDSLDDDNDNEFGGLHLNKRLKNSQKRKKSSASNVINEEKELNEVDSSFKHDLNTIYYECCEESIKINGPPESTDKVSKSCRTWLSFINQRCMPTIPIWSNMLVGNLSRHGQSSVQAFDALLVSTHDERTNAISERRMGIVKRTQLGVETRIRADVVLQILVRDMQRLVENFSISYMATMYRTSNLDNGSQLVLNEVRENWKQSNYRGHGYYCKHPNESIKNNLKNGLITCSSNINNNLSIPVLSISNWLNVTIAILLSIKVFRETPPEPSLTMRSILVEIIHFIKNWVLCLNRIKLSKKTSPEQKELLNFEFHLPSNVPTDIDQQIAYIIDKILIPLLDCTIPVKIIYTCTSCKSIIETRSEINYILINMVNNQFHLNHQLSNYFAGGVSDYKCNKCHSYMLRRIQIFDCPSVIILKIDHTKSSATTSCKSPNAICFSQFLDTSSIGSPSSTVYDVVGFLSINSTGDNKEKKLISVTKIKQRWYVNPLKKLIGNGANFSKWFATSRIIILERIRTCSSNFLYAIAQCCSVIIQIKDEYSESYKTLRSAIKTIENNKQFDDLRARLLSTSITYYICNKCHSSSDSLSLLFDCIHIYEQDSNNSCTHGIPLLYNESRDLHCSICNEKPTNVILPIHTQIHIQFPLILMCRLSHTTFNTVMNFHVELTDHARNQHIYKPISALLVDEYNALSIIKLKERFVYCSSPYQTLTSTSNNEIDDLFHTARTVIVFLEYETATDLNNSINNNPNINYSPEHSPPPVPSPSHQQIDTYLKNATNNNPNVQHSPAPAHQERTFVTAAASISLKQPLAVSIFDKTTNKTTTGTLRSLTITKK